MSGYSALCLEGPNPYIEVLKDKGAEFVVPFFSGSCSLALNLSLQSHQMTPFFTQNEN